MGIQRGWLPDRRTDSDTEAETYRQIQKQKTNPDRQTHGKTGIQKYADTDKYTHGDKLWSRTIIDLRNPSFSPYSWLRFETSSQRLMKIQIISPSFWEL